MTLYEELLEWRNEVAKKEGIMPAMVCSLDLLVFMAYKRLVCRRGMKRLCYFLPELLEESSSPDYLDDAFSTIIFAGGNSSNDGEAEPEQYYSSDRIIKRKKEKEDIDRSQNEEEKYPELEESVSTDSTTSV